MNSKTQKLMVAVMVALTLIISGCSSTVSTSSNPLPDIAPLTLPPAEPEQPEIRQDLLIPCYSDLMPVKPTGPAIAEINRVNAENNRRANLCYLRQLSLINEVKLRNG